LPPPPVVKNRWKAWWVLPGALDSSAYNVAHLKHLVNRKCCNSEIFFIYFFIMSILRNMTGLTVEEMAKILRLEKGTVRVRLSRAGIKPITHSPVYPESALETIRNVPGKGRPPKAKPEDPEKPEKPAKK
jgi:hypothetical protein